MKNGGKISYLMGPFRKTCGKVLKAIGVVVPAGGECVVLASCLF
ncbi:MAG: hypothetical protein PHO53_01675 [Actinomycetota bacterium]|nr:hypothetical protein [Actinomycetota bacterium]